MEDVTMIPVQSKTIAEMGLDAHHDLMYVKFTSGTVYSYSNVSQAEFDSISTDVSIGSKLRRVVKDKLYAKLNEDNPNFKRLKY